MEYDAKWENIYKKLSKFINYQYYDDIYDYILNIKKNKLSYYTILFLLKEYKIDSFNCSYKVIDDSQLNKFINLYNIKNKNILSAIKNIENKYFYINKIINDQSIKIISQNFYNINNEYKTNQILIIWDFYYSNNKTYNHLLFVFCELINKKEIKHAIYITINLINYFQYIYKKLNINLLNSALIKHQLNIN